MNTSLVCIHNHCG